jgi:hypothetical protein
MTDLKVSESVVMWIFVLLVGAGAYLSGWAYHRGYIRGSCVEMCRPLKFDSDQDVNGGCLCIGSDRALRRKNDP